MVTHICKLCCWEYEIVRNSDDIPNSDPVHQWVKKRQWQHSLSGSLGQLLRSVIKEEDGMEQKKSEKVFFMHSA